MARSESRRKRLTIVARHEPEIARECKGRSMREIQSPTRDHRAGPGIFETLTDEPRGATRKAWGKTCKETYNLKVQAKSRNFRFPVGPRGRARLKFISKLESDAVCSITRDWKMPSQYLSCWNQITAPSLSCYARLLDPTVGRATDRLDQSEHLRNKHSYGSYKNFGPRCARAQSQRR